MNRLTTIVSAASFDDANPKAEDSIRRHSRSFSIAARLLPGRVRTSVHGLYAWCRTVDDAVDEAASNDEAEQILNLLENDLDRMRRGHASIHLASAWIEPLVVAGRIDIKHAKELVAGMRMDLQSYRVQSDGELYRYCYHAAGTVGLMMMRLMGVQDPAAGRHAIALGVAMQLTNIARDVREDAARGRSYLPGISDPLSADPQVVRTAVAEILSTAERRYEIASAGLKFLPWDCRFSIRIALALYREIGRQIQRSGYQVLGGRLVVSKSRLIGVLAVTLVTSIAEDLKLTLCSIPPVIQDTPMNDNNFAQPSTVAQAKHAVYLGISLTAIMAAALFVMVMINPKDASYSYLPLLYSSTSLFVAVLFNRMAARCELSQQSSVG